VDPEDDRKFDPKEMDRNLDMLGQLIKQGRNKEAVDLCKKLQDSSEGSHLALDATLHRLYLETVEAAENSPLLANVRQLIEKGEFDQAESQLKHMLAVHPTSGATWVLLMRFYSKNRLRPDQALAVLDPIDKPGPLHPAFTDYARKSINQWVVEGNAPAKSNGEHGSAAVEAQVWEPELSVDELLKNNKFATAVERLEKSISQEPQNFDLRLKLAEVYAVHCADSNRAGKIIQKIENNPAFSAEQIQMAKAQLREWQKVRR
jgi:predicted Zn-dependent protease